MRLILASASPRRAELLRAAGYEFDIHAVEIDERLRAGESPVEYVQRLAQEKSARALQKLLRDGPPNHLRQGYGGPPKRSAKVEGGHYVLHEPTLVLGADTAVVIASEILGKPRDVEDAARMLRLLSGRTHQVMTGVCLVNAERSVSHVEISDVTFARLTEDQIAWYVSSGEGGDKAGGYAIQGLAARFIPRIEGSYSNVVGLPIASVDDLIHRLTTPRSVLASGE